MTVKPAPIFPILAVLMLAGCNPPTDGQDASVEPTAAAEEPVDEAVSILRPDISSPIAIEEPQPDESYTATIGFPEGGSDLNADAIAALEQVRASEQFAGPGAIILRTHSDSGGNDTANARASEKRGLAVAEWLISAGADARRIDVIVFGEQNPAEPNALPDGSPNEAGRAANRRVEVEILSVPSTAPKDGASKASD